MHTSNSVDGKGYLSRGTPSCIARENKRATVGLHNALCNGETETMAFRVSLVGSLTPDEPVENAGQ